MAVLDESADYRALYESAPSLSFGALGGLAIEDQPTWIIPVVQGRRGAADRGLQEGAISLVRGLVINLGIYGVASFLLPLSSLILVPFLTHHLSRDEYGALAVLTAAIALVAGITQLGLG